MSKPPQCPEPAASPPDEETISTPAVDSTGKTAIPAERSREPEPDNKSFRSNGIAREAGGRLAPILKRILERNRLVRCRRKHAYLVIARSGNPTTLRLGSASSDAHIAKVGMSMGFVVRRRDREELNALLLAIAIHSAKEVEVWCRVATISEGAEIVVDLGDEAETRVRITPGNVELITEGCDVLFWRPATSRPMVCPASQGDLRRLKRLLVNLHPLQLFLLVAWLGYTLAHGKTPTSRFLILLLLGGEGTGKSSAGRVIQTLCDPSTVGLQIFPTDPRQLAIATQHAHVVVFDNLRRLNQMMADALCIASTGGALLTRKLYTDGDAAVTDLHGAVVLNGIHEFVDQADLAQRCLPLRLLPLSGEQRRTEAEMADTLREDLPYILRGIFDEIAQILIHLPTVEVTSSQRMADFSRWLAAKEKVEGVPAGTFQSAYATVVEEGQRDAIMNHPLAAALLEFAENEIRDEWRGTPSDLLDQLCARASIPTQRSMGWPRNAISLSKKCVSLQAALRSQGVIVDLHRGKDRVISIRKADHA
jgi:hypothetical protein